MKSSTIKIWLASLLLGVTGVNGSAIEANPWILTSDSLILFKGTTHRYTVDTPEKEGLVSTLLNVSELKEYLSRSGMGNHVLYASNGQVKSEGIPERGDYLRSTISKKRLSIGVRKGAIPPIIKLDRSAFTIKTAGTLTLDFFAGQRSPMTTVSIRVPAGIDVTLDNTTVNVIGRGEVLLRDLPTQSIGRTGTNYSYKKVGEVEIRKEGTRGTLLLFTGLDFRPSNGPDLRLCFRGVALPAKGEFKFEAAYSTSEPEKLNSPIVVTTLQGITTVADFTRNTLRDFTYKKDQDLSFSSFHWSAPLNAKSVTIMQSEDKGKTWTAVRGEILPDDDFGAAYKLKPDQLYAFKLRVVGGPNAGDSNIAWF